MPGSEQANCPQCGRKTARRGGRGRPAVYCDATCRRAAEYQLRRLQGLLRRAEQKQQDASLAVAMAVRWGQADAQRALDFWTAEVERLEAELRQVLAAQPVEAPTEKPV